MACISGSRNTFAPAGMPCDGGSPGDRYVGVHWRLADGQRAQVLSFGRRTDSQVLHFARSLRPGRLPSSPAPFRLAEVPRGLTLSYLTGDYLCLSPKPATRETTPQGLCVHVETVSEVTLPPGVGVTVGGRPAVFESSSELQIDLGRNRVLMVATDPATVPLRTGDLVRFANGVRVIGS
jgi:hypothetical protein